eukprot:4662664-Pleurochrysis_carterae.AAC.1
MSFSAAGGRRSACLVAGAEAGAMVRACSWLCCRVADWRHERRRRARQNPLPAILCDIPTL